MASGAFPSGGVYCAGNIVVDILVRPVDALPPWGSSNWVESIEQHLGGNGAITACALGKLRAHVRLAGLVGDDDFGRYALTELSSAGIDLSGVATLHSVPTATTIGLVNQRSERLFFHSRGASGRLGPEHICLERERLSGFSYFHLGSFFHMPAMRQGGAALLDRAQQAGLITSLDTMWDSAGRWMLDFAPLCPFLDLLFVNQDEARMLSGSDEPAAVGDFFRNAGVGTVVFKMAEEGCVVLSADEEFAAPAYDVASVDSTGAGDSFCGGFLAALSRGFSLRRAASFANAVAAHSIQQIGGTQGLAPFEETMRWMAQAPLRSNPCSTLHS